jgi:hypothetical protein
MNLAQFHGTVLVFFFGSFIAFKQFFGFPTFSAWVPLKRLNESKSASGASKLGRDFCWWNVSARGSQHPICYVLWYLLENTDMNFNCQEKIELYKFISKWRIISLMHSSILRRILLHFKALCLGFLRDLYSYNISNFQFFRPEHHWEISKCTSRASKLVSYEFYI